MKLFEKESLYIRRIKKFTEALAVGTGIILFWRGIWNLADIFLFPGHPLISACSSFFLGICILLLTRSFVKQFLGEMQAEEIRAEKTMIEKLLGR